MSTDANSTIDAQNATTAMSKGAETRVNEWRRKFSVFLNARLRPLGINRVEFAKILNCGVQALSSWLNGEAAPSKDRALLIGANLNAKDRVRKLWKDIFALPKSAKHKPIPRGVRIFSLAGMAARPVPRRIAARFA